MTLYEQWDKYGEEARLRSTEEYKKVVEKYLNKERMVYNILLSKPEEIVEGTISELAVKYNMDDVEFLGFVDGMNESLKQGPYDLNSLTADSVVRLDYDLQKLYWNMLDAKADWLFNLPQWKTLLTDKERHTIEQNFKQSKTFISGKKIGRNDPCTCGSGKKYKHCCMNKIIPFKKMITN